MGNVALPIAAPLAVVMTRAPVPGQNKTRLHARLGPEGADALHRAMLTDVLEAVRESGVDGRICVAGDPKHPFFDKWRGWASIETQAPGNLGDKLARAFRDADLRPVFALGADAPTLPVQILTDLAQSDTQVTLVPARDGGYVSIGLHQASLDVFRNIPWSTASVKSASA